MVPVAWSAPAFLAVFSGNPVRRAGWLPTSRGSKKITQYSDVVFWAFSGALSHGLQNEEPPARGNTLGGLGARQTPL